MEKWKKILLKMNFWTISVFVITSLVVVSHVHAFSITSAEVSGDGKEESRPAKESKVANVVVVVVKATWGQFQQPFGAECRAHAAFATKDIIQFH